MWFIFCSILMISLAYFYIESDLTFTCSVQIELGMLCYVLASFLYGYCEACLKYEEPRGKESVCNGL